MKCNDTLVFPLAIPISLFAETTFTKSSYKNGKIRGNSLIYRGVYVLLKMKTYNRILNIHQCNNVNIIFTVVLIIFQQKFAVNFVVVKGSFFYYFESDNIPPQYNIFHKLKLKISPTPSQFVARKQQLAVYIQKKFSSRSF